jgi:hypothetical protein
MHTQPITETIEKHQPASLGTDGMGWTWQIARPVPVSPEQIRREARKYGRTHAPGQLPIRFRARPLAERRAA